MDCGNDYIKMCKKAEEIQEFWDRHKGDWYADPFWNNEKQGDDWNIYVLESDNQYLYQPRYTWLPRQDQLQEMMEDATYYKLKNIFSFMINPDHHIPFNISMEQLWLTFIMKERFKKIWNGEEWILNE